jgi:hypothetical protein
VPSLDERPIITSASLSFQWQREMKETFRGQFDVIHSDVLRANYGMNLLSCG